MSPLAPFLLFISPVLDDGWLTHPPLAGGSHSDTDQDCAIKLMSA